MDPAEAEQALKRLRADYAGRWHIWRSQANGEPWWYATRLTPSAGVVQTAWGAGPAKLRAELEQQRQLAAQRLP
jgi:hypothetical protein